MDVEWDWNLYPRYEEGNQDLFTDCATGSGRGVMLHKKPAQPSTERFYCRKMPKVATLSLCMTPQALEFNSVKTNKRDPKI